MFKKAFSQALDRAVTRAGSGGKLHAHGSGTDIPGTPDAPSYHTGHIQPWHDDGGTPVNARSSDDIIAELFNRYFEAEFEPLQHELGALPDNVNETLLESLVEGRTLELEAVTERLAGHVLANYDKFVDGINEVGSIESHLTSALAATKVARQQLGSAAHEVETNMFVGKQTRRKQALVQLLDVLLRLKEAYTLHEELKVAQEGASFGEAFWLCSQSLTSMQAVADLTVAQQLTATIKQQYQELLLHLEGSLSAVCIDFDAQAYTKVLEGYVCVDAVTQLGEDVKGAFAGAAGNAVVKVVRGVLLSRGSAIRDDEDDQLPIPYPTSTEGLQDLLRTIPQDLFRTTLANVLMVTFDIMSSHHRMVTWHREALERHAVELSRIQRYKNDIKQRSGSVTPSPRGGGGVGGSTTPSTPSGEGGGHGGHAAVHGGVASPHAATTPASPRTPTLRMGQRVAHMTTRAGGDVLQQPATGGVHGNEEEEEDAGEMSLDAQLQDLEAKERDELDWGQVLQTVAGALADARRLLWDEAARKLSMLLSSQSGFQGEHFLQVLEWSQRIVAIGEVFSGMESGALRMSLARQSGVFFKSFHKSNMEALASMLEKEIWRTLPTPAVSGAAVLGSLRETLMGGPAGPSLGPSPGPSPLQSPRPADGSTPTAGGGGGGGGMRVRTFEQWVAGGNPWKTGHRRKQSLHPPTHTTTTAMEQYGIRVPPTATSTAVAAVSNGVGGVGQVSHHTAVGGVAEDGLVEDDGVDEEEGEEEEEEGLYADYIDEDTQQAVFAGDHKGGRGGGDRGEGGHTNHGVMMTNSSWRTLSWLKEYITLMRTLQPVASTVFTAMCELFELYMLHVMATFGDVPLGHLINQHTSGGGGGGGLGGALGGGGGGLQSAARAMDAMTPRLKNTMVRIVTESLASYPTLLYGPHKPPDTTTTTGGVSSGAAAMGAAMDSAIQRLKERHLGGGGVGGGGGILGMDGALGSKVSYAGNMFGLRERLVAIESLLCLANELKHAKGPLTSVLGPSDTHAVEQFFQRTVATATDVRDAVLRTAARLNLPLVWLPDAVSACTFHLPEPPVKHNPWVDQLLGASRMFRDRLAAMEGLSQEHLQLLWQHAIGYIAEALLDGLAKVKRCNLEGRAGMSVDLQTLSRGLQAAAPAGVVVHLRVVDTYIKGFYIPATELRHWAATHPEYTREQVLALASLIADAAGYKRKDRLSLLQLIEADLNSLDVG